MTAPAAVRALGAPEIAMDLLEHAASGHIVRVIACDGAIDAAVLQRAVGDLVVSMPILRTRIVRPPDDAPYFAYHDEPTPFEVRERPGPDAWIHEFDRQLNTRLNADGPLIRVTVLTSGREGGEIFVTIAHAVCDGRSIQDFCRELVLQYERRVAGGAVATPPEGQVRPAADQLLPEWMSGERLDEMIAEFMKNETYFGEMPAAHFADESGADPSSPVTHFRSFTLRPAQLAGLHDAAKANGTNVHGALCAAQLLASAHSGKVDVDEAFLLVHSMDLRPWLRVPLAASDLGMYSAGFQTKSAAVSKREFWDVARESKNQIEDAVARNEHLLTLKLMSMISTKSLGAHTFSGLALISNIGLVDVTAGTSLRVREIHGGTAMHVNPSMIYCFAIGFGGLLRVNLFQPFPAMSDDTADGIRSEMLDLLGRYGAAGDA